MTRAAANLALTCLLTLALVAVAGDAQAKPAHRTKKKPAKAKTVKVAKARTVKGAKAGTSTRAAVIAAAHKTAAAAMQKTAEPPSPDALLARLAPAVNAKVKASSVDALVARACALGETPVAKPANAPKVGRDKLAYMHSLTSKATSLGFAPIVRMGARPTGDSMVVRMKDRPLASKVILAVVRRNRRDVTSCHEVAAIRGKAPRGNVTLRFVVAPSGKVARVRVVASGDSAASFERCVEGRIRSWRFPKGETRTPFNYSLTLQ